MIRLIMANDEPCADALEIASVSMNDGLVCELAGLPGDDGECALFISDPVANIRRQLPALPTHRWADDVSPTIVIAVDKVARSFNVFFLVYNKQEETEMYVYESSSSEWRGLASPPKDQQLAEVASAVVFHSILYVVFNTSHLNTMCSLLSYSLRKDMWEVEKADMPRWYRQYLLQPQVFVNEDELWMTRWFYDSDLHLTMEDGLYFEAENLRISDDHPAEVRAFMQEIYGHIEWYLGECYGIERTYPYPYFHTFFDDGGGG